MNRQQIEAYRKDKDFNLKEAIWVLSTVDELTNEELAEQFKIAADIIEQIVEIHQKYWDSIKHEMTPFG